MAHRQLDELQWVSKGDSLADLMARQTLRVGQVVDVATDVAKEIALMHDRGLAYGALDSRNIRIGSGHASLAPLGPAVDGRTLDDIRDFCKWLRGLMQELPADTSDRRRIALDEIATRYLQTEGLPASTRMKKAAMALSMLRVASQRITLPEVLPVSVSANSKPAPHKISRKGKVLLLVRVVPATEATSSAPSNKAIWYATAATVAALVGTLFYFIRRIL